MGCIQREGHFEILSQPHYDETICSDDMDQREHRGGEPFVYVWKIFFASAPSCNANAKYKHPDSVRLCDD